MREISGECCTAWWNACDFDMGYGMQSWDPSVVSALQVKVEAKTTKVMFTLGGWRKSRNSTRARSEPDGKGGRE